MSRARPGRVSWDVWQSGTARSIRLTADDVMTARDVARLLHAPISTVEDWARRGILPSVKIGRRRLYIRQNIEAALTGLTGAHTLDDERGSGLG
jgi:excisionase family DNA binding protein